jgi:lipoprotein
MKRCLYVLNVLTMIWSLAACGKAVSSPRALSETEEIHLGYVDENSAIEIVDTEKITVRPDKINVGFAQSSNLLEWQVAQTESFYAAFMESDGYHLNITDAHGDAERQREQLENLISAPMDVLFIVPVNPDEISDIVVRAENAGIRVILLEAEEAKALGGDEARRQLERDTLTYETDKKR